MPSYGNSPQDAVEAIELLSKKTLPVAKMITHVLSLAEAGLGFKLMTSGQDSLKVIIEPHK